MSMEWVKLGDCCTITSSKRVFANQYVDSGIPFYRSKEIIERRAFKEISEPLYISKDVYDGFKTKFGVPVKGDILLTSVGTLGIPYLVKSNEEFYFKDGNLTWMKNFTDRIDSEYLYYWLSSSFGKSLLLQRAIGSSQAAITIEILKKYKLLLPLVYVQHRIASILSTYDTLIENNAKRIRLLEKMAENLYKEWFVRFRFPGHENVEMENGLPKGWKRGSLSDVCEFKRGKNITSSEMQEGNVPVISAGLEPSGYHSCSNVRGVNVTMSSSGANAGYIAIHYSDIWAADCSYIEESTTGNIYYVYELLNNIRTVINNFQRGAAQPHVYPKDVNRIKLILPSKELMLKANGRLEIMHKEIYNLQKQNSLLARQRDLLLPRLMSGKLEVKEELLE